MGYKGELYAPAEVIPIIERQYPWLRSHIDMIPCDEGVDLDGWRIDTWKVNHGKNGYSNGWKAPLLRNRSLFPALANQRHASDGSLPAQARWNPDNKPMRSSLFPV